MIAVPAGMRVLVATRPIDFRKGADGCQHEPHALGCRRDHCRHNDSALTERPPRHLMPSKRLRRAISPRPARLRPQKRTPSVRRGWEQPRDKKAPCSSVIRLTSGPVWKVISGPRDWSMATGAREGRKEREPSVMTDIELLATIVRGDRDIVASLSGVDAGGVSAVGQRSTACCRSWLSGWRTAKHVPTALRTLLRTRGTDALVMDLARVAELKQLLRALARGGVLPLLLKGAHLAYSHYARPYLRPKPDTDLLVPPHARDAVRRIVLDLSADEPCPAIPERASSPRRRHSRSGAAAG